MSCDSGTGNFEPRKGSRTWTLSPQCLVWYSITSIQFCKALTKSKVGNHYSHLKRKINEACREDEAVRSSFWPDQSEAPIFIETQRISILHSLQNPVFKAALCTRETKYFLTSRRVVSTSAILPRGNWGLITWSYQVPLSLYIGMQAQGLGSQKYAFYKRCV